MITLKHLAQEYNIDPYPLRQALRKSLPHKRNQRWQWQPTDPNLVKARKIAEHISSTTNYEYKE